MISVARSNSGLDPKRNTIEEKRGEAKVSCDGADSPEEEKARVSGIELDSAESEAIGRALEDNGSAKDAKDIARVGGESDVDTEMRNEKKPSFFQFGLQSESFDSQHDEFDDDENHQIEYAVPGGNTKAEVYNSLLSEFDDFVTNEKHGAMVGTSRALRFGFEVGDLVWGKVKSHPWWPGHIFNEAFASSSVRRTRREGYVLVAFFGDSSYGWFDPAELIPFDPNFAEKSQQTSSRNFLKAVEEAVDEASRRCGLGVVCRCRNKYNFRPTNVQGYFEVDVPDYEPRGVYSENQIKKARDGFKPGQILSLMKQFAVAPQGYDLGTIDVINKATVFAFRKALFDEFDEPYAQAFGMQPKRNANDPANLPDQPAKAPTRAPLSGPLVIAEALGSKKSSKKSLKVKDHSKKDIYLFKRRDEPVDSGALQLGQSQSSCSSPAVFKEDSSAIVTGDCVLQKRFPASLSAKKEHPEIISNEVAGASEDVFGKEAVILDQAPESLGAQDAQGTVVDSSLPLDKEKDVLQEIKKKNVDHSNTGVKDGVSPFKQEGEAMVDIRNEESAEVSRSIEVSMQTESFSARAEGENSLVKQEVGVKKVKVLKRPLGALSSENPVIREKKKKKKKESGTETSPDRPKKLLDMETGGALGGKSTDVVSREDLRGNHQKKFSTGNAAFSGAGTLPMGGMGIVEIELPHLLSTLHFLALDPFYGAERNILSIAMQFFLLFRSRVFEKSLVLSAQSETEHIEAGATKSSSAVGVPNNSAGVKDLTPSRPVKSLVRQDDPTKGQRKRSSERQEEIAAKKLKKMNLLKSLSADKKVGQSTSETRRTEGKEPVTAAPPKSVKSHSAKKMEPQPRVVEPAMLVMKFPPQTSLPSAAKLKARFARFGSIDQSGIRVFWQTSTCRVVFRHKLDAQAAYKYAVGNNSLFGNVNVRYSLREVGAPAHEAPEPDKGRGDDTSLQAPRLKDLTIEKPPQLHQPLHPQSSVQLKSILKKPTGDEAGQVTGGKGTARVKFMLGGEETSKGEQMMIGNRNFNNNTNFADGGAATTNVHMDFNSKKFQKVILPSSSSPSQILPLATQFTKISHNNLHHSEVAPRNMHNLNIPVAPPPTIDISQQMLSLLTKCKDVVTSVTGLLGYEPYHPL